jgi:phosphopantothenoylcysteine decarboxylase/phosphopantothenate--cysteine ligase
VADFRPREQAPTKLAKADGVPEITLEPTPDILAGLGRARVAGQVLVGFAAETGEVAARARAKLAAKGVDIVVGNDVSSPDAGFDHDTNRAVIVEADGTATDVPLVDKRVLASVVLDVVARHLGPADANETADASDTADADHTADPGRTATPNPPTGLRASTRRSTS